MRSVGDVVYEWRLDTDGLTWSDNASALLGVDVDEIGTGRAFAQHVDAARGPTRIDVIQQTTRRETGNGVPYQIQYAFKRGDEKIWLEDIGRWFAASTASRCVRTVLVRFINERRERERRLEQRAKFDPLTGELNRVGLTEALGAALNEAVRFRGSCGFLLVAITSTI